MTTIKNWALKLWNLQAFKTALRTYLQAFVGFFTALWVGSGLDVSQLHSTAALAVLWKIAAAAAVSAFPALWAYLQNLLENKGAIKPILKPTNPEPGA